MTIWSAWRYGGEDPWRLFNLLDRNYRYVWDPVLPAMRPTKPSRLRSFMYACGTVALIMDGKVKDEKRAPKRPPNRAERRSAKRRG